MKALSAASTPRAAPARANSAELLYPLNVTYARAGIDAPAASPLLAEDVPSPYHELLVHEDSMTLRLERFTQNKLRVKAIDAFVIKAWYYRRLGLVQEDGKAIAIAAVRIQMTEMSATVRQEIRAAVTPLGRILQDNGVVCERRCVSFCAVQPNEEMVRIFKMSSPLMLYGRRAEMFHNGKHVVDVTEVLTVFDTWRCPMTLRNESANEKLR